jgi:lysozyme
MSDARQRALINLCFNLGIDGLLKFEHTLADLQMGHYDVAAHELETSQPWASQVGKRANRLADLIRQG